MFVRIGGDGFFPLGRKEEHGTGATLVNHVTVESDQRQAFGHRVPRAGDSVVHAINEGRRLKSGLQHARLAGVYPLVDVCGLGKNYAVGKVLGHLPAIAGVNLLDVNNVEIDLVFPATVDIVNGTSLVPEGRSSVAAKNKRDRPFV